jgi:hypothetical protein
LEREDGRGASNRQTLLSAGRYNPNFFLFIEILVPLIDIPIWNISIFVVEMTIGARPKVTIEIVIFFPFKYGNRHPANLAHIFVGSHFINFRL